MTKLYKTGNGKLIHTNVNGSLNILRKVVPTAFSLGIRGVVVLPMPMAPASPRKLSARLRRTEELR